MTKVSVCIASYNHARFLPRCLDSILSQTFQDFEIVIVDDGSQDGSHKLLVDYQTRFPEKIKYYWHPGHENKGVSVTTNIAMRQSKGEFIAWIGSDDVWLPDKLAVQLQIFNAEPEVGLVYSLAECIDENDHPVPDFVGVDITKEKNPLGCMLILCYVPAPTAMVRCACLDLVGLYDETLAYSDWDLMIRIFSHYKPAFIEKPLTKYRIHGKNMSLGIDPKLHLQRDLDVLFGISKKSKNIGGLLLEPRNMAILDLQIAFHLFCKGNEKEAVEYLHQSYQKDPLLIRNFEKFYKWPNKWRPVFYTPQHKHFGLWAIYHLHSQAGSSIFNEQIRKVLDDPDTMDTFVQQGVQLFRTEDLHARPEIIFMNYGNTSLIPVSWKRKILSRIYTTLLYESYQAREFYKTRYYWKKAIFFAPPSLLTNKGFWSIGMRIYLGENVKKFLKRILLWRQHES